LFVRLRTARDVAIVVLKERVLNSVLNPYPADVENMVSS